MRVLYIGYALWKSIVQAQTFGSFHVIVEGNDRTIYAGRDDVVYSADVDNPTDFADWSAAFPGSTLALSEDAAVATIMGLGIQVYVRTRGPELVTYDALVTEAGGTNKSMASIFNPSGSGKIIKLRNYSVQAASSSGTTVIITYEVRRISAHSGGTNLTPKKRDTNDVNSIAIVKDAPSVTEISDPTQHSFILQSNTMQSPMAHFRDLTIGEAKPIILREGEGIVMHQVTNQGGTFHVGFVWTEE